MWKTKQNPTISEELRVFRDSRHSSSEQTPFVMAILWAFVALLHLGPSRPKLEKESENEFPGLIQKVENGVEREST